MFSKILSAFDTKLAYLIFMILMIICVVLNLALIVMGFGTPLAWGSLILCGALAVYDAYKYQNTER